MSYAGLPIRGAVRKSPHYQNLQEFALGQGLNTLFCYWECMKNPLVGTKEVIRKRSEAASGGMVKSEKRLTAQ